MLPHRRSMESRQERIWFEWKILFLAIPLWKLRKCCICKSRSYVKAHASCPILYVHLQRSLKIMKQNNQETVFQRTSNHLYMPHCYFKRLRKIRERHFSSLISETKYGWIKNSTFTSISWLLNLEYETLPVYLYYGSFWCCISCLNFFFFFSSRSCKQ